MSGTLHALILQDNRSDIDCVLDELTRAGFEVHLQQAQTQEDFLARVNSQVDVILADSCPARFGALEALLALQQCSLSIPLIVVTSGAGEQAAVDCMKSGAFDYILKHQLAQLGPAVARAKQASERRDKEQLARTEIQRRNRELTLLTQIVAASAAGLEPASLLDSGCRELALAFGVPHAAAFLFDSQVHTATFVAEHLPPDWDRQLGSSEPVTGNPVFEHILSERAPLVANNGPDDPRLAPIRRSLVDSSTTSMLVLPLTVDNKAIGGVSLRAVEPYSFTVQQVGLAWRVADQLSSAIARSGLDKERKLLTAAIQQTAESVIITDATGTIVYVNPGFEQTTGYSRAEAIGQTPRLLKSGKHSPAFYHDLWSTLTSGQRWRGRRVNRRKDGTQYTVDSSIAPVRDEGGQIVSYVDVQRDITHELQLEEQYLQAQKMEAVGRLAGGIAHDFNNLLTAIKGFTGLLLGDLSGAGFSPAAVLSVDHKAGLDTELMRSDLEGIDHATDQAAALIQRLMTFSRRHPPEPKVIDLNKVVTESEKMLRRLIGEDVELVTSLSPQIGRIKADPGHVEQVIMNLAVNARDAMPSGGTFTLRTEFTLLDRVDIEDHPGLRPGKYVLLSVSDTGTGMDAQVRSHLFEPFFTTKEEGRGTGLGLATVHSIVIQNNGYIEVSSTLGAGTTFKVYLPSVALDARAAAQEPVARALPTGRETILVVEDEDFVRELTTRVLEQQGYTVLSAGHPDEALRWSDQHKGPIHLLLADVIMPAMYGTDLARVLMSSRSDFKTLYVSGYAANAIAQHGVLEPDVAFLRKPFTATALAYKVRQVLDGS